MRTSPTTVPTTCQQIKVTPPLDQLRKGHLLQDTPSKDSPDTANTFFEQLDFHPLPIIHLAIVANQNRWSLAYLTQKWDKQWTDAFRMRHNRSLGMAVELSLSSPMFTALRPDVRGTLESTVFFPQGVDESNLGWLFRRSPTSTTSPTCFVHLLQPTDVKGSLRRSPPP